MIQLMQLNIPGSLYGRLRESNQTLTHIPYLDNTNVGNTNGICRYRCVPFVLCVLSARITNMLLKKNKVEEELPAPSKKDN